MDRKKELKEMYKNMKTDMGLFIIKSNFNDMYYIEGTQDLKGTINSTKFKLDFGNHPNKELQQQWKDQGESGFTIEILDKLEYDKDESKVDYTEELNILTMIWEEKLSKKGMEFYGK
ncbi:GIY-YIG nuclease family protein [Clostridium sp. UBA4548]|uniref:GIY-YIG nuclease family protein n=1 Tax=Clostridium sp. UBA4548 TaxID=1946361 RepID=UPI0025BAA368|nr:GIY-YIG nuclease family protein [Clostridium sp. UBA4548]